MTELDRTHLVEALRTSGNSLRQLSGMSAEQMQMNYEQLTRCLEDLANVLQQAAHLLENSEADTP
jgi:hypothetical protein